jgi:anti-sigma B factor antagonist
MVRPARLEVRVQPDRARPTLAVDGELDLSSVPLLAQHIDSQIESEPDAVTLDLSGITFMDSSGLRLLIELNERAKRDGWSLSLIAPQHDSATLVLRMTGADRALPFEGPPLS